MSQRLPALTARQLIKILEARGWSLHRTRGSHHQFVHPDRDFIITVPVHRGDLKPGLVAGILKDAGIKREDLARPRRQP